MKWRNRTYNTSNQETQTPIIKKQLTITVPEYLSYEVLRLAQELVVKDMLFSGIGGKEKGEMIKELLCQMSMEFHHSSLPGYLV